MAGELKNPKHEHFAQLRGSGKTLGASVAEAFGRPDDRNATAYGTKLAKQPEIAARIAFVVENYEPEEEALTPA